MAKVSDRQLAVGRVYAKALIDLTPEADVQQTLCEELAEFVRVLDANPALEAYFSNPTGDPEARAAMLEKLFRGRASDLFVNALQIINRKDRLGDVRGIAAAFAVMVDEQRDRVQVRVISAVPLSDETRKPLKAVLDKYTGKDAQLAESVDSDLLGGLVIYVGDEKFDMSVIRQLHRLTESFVSRGRSELIRGGHLAMVEGI